MSYNFAPTRAPPINMPVLNLPGSFDGIVSQFGDVANSIVAGNRDILDWVIVGFAAYGGFILIPRILRAASKAFKKIIK